MSNKNRQQRQAGQSLTSQQTATANIQAPDPSPSRIDLAHLQFSASITQSPLPDPAILRELNDLVPNHDAAERILTVFEHQAEHRIDLERRAVYQETARAAQGMYLSAALGMLIIGASVWTGVTGHEILAGAFLGTDFIGAIGAGGAYVWGSRQRRKERVQKAEVMAAGLARRSQTR